MRMVVVLAFLGLVLAGCASLPRGAGLQSEVLARAGDLPPDTVEDGIPLPQDFAVEPVTEANLATFAQWPVTDASGLAWIERVDQPDNRIISPGDLITVTIWTTEENGLLTTAGERVVTLPEMQVSSGGEIFLPYVGQARITGMAPETARARIEESYLEIIPSAQVQVSVVEGRQRTVSVVDGVGAPGVYPLADQDVTLLEILAEAGGVAGDFSNPQVRLQRGGDLYGVSLSRLLDSPRLNTTLVGGDRIYIEEDERSFLSLGAAGTEAIHRFPSDRVTALEALSLIGGVTPDRADAQGILILREYPPGVVRADRTGPAHERTIFVIDLTSADGLFSAGQFEIRSGDLVYVTESPINGARTVLGLIGSVFGLVNQLQ